MGLNKHTKRAGKDISKAGDAVMHLDPINAVGYTIESGLHLATAAVTGVGSWFGFDDAGGVAAGIAAEAHPVVALGGAAEEGQKIYKAGVNGELGAAVVTGAAINYLGRKVGLKGKGDNIVEGITDSAKKTTRENAALLRKNMAKEGRLVDRGEAAAHVVPSTGSKGHWAKGAESRELLQKRGVDINDPANGVALGHPRPHNKTHTKSFHEATNARLKSVESTMLKKGRGNKAIKKALRKELRKIGSEQ